MTDKNKYAQDGVNVEVGDNVSDIAGKVCVSTYQNNEFVKVHDLSKGHFRGKRAYSFTGLPSGYLIDQSSDGVGTKSAIIAAAGTYKDAFKDLVAMTCGDMVAAGSLPLVMNNVLDVSSLGNPNDETFRTFLAAVELIKGMESVAKDENLVIFKGETAELGAYVGSENPKAVLKFNWGATVTGVTYPKKMITGKTLKPGQLVVVLREHGFRSNGISSVRRALAINYGNAWWDNPRAQEDILAAAAPSVSYNNFIAHLHGWYYPKFAAEVKLHAVAHITGGGIVSKLIKDFLKPRGLSVDLENLFEPSPIMQKCIEWRGLNMEEAFSTFNMGQGMVIVIDQKNFSQVRNIAKQYNIEVEEAGFITKRVSSRIKSQFFNETLVV